MGKGHVRRGSGGGIRVRVGEDRVDDVHDAVREEHVGLDDARGDVAERDVLAARVDREGERLARGGRVVLRAREERRVHGRAVDDL